MSAFINNKSILKNTAFLYVRMLILMLIGFITVRIVLKSLGIEDYGIYNVVGSIVIIFQFVNGSLMTAAQRYFSMEIATGNVQSLNKIFCLILTIFGLIGIIIIILCESAGLWFLNNKLVIPEERLSAANYVFQFSLFSFIINLITVPFNALIVSYEKMSAFAWLGLIEGIAKLGVAIIIYYIGFDKLIAYSGLHFFMTIIVMGTYYAYCHNHFKSCKYRLFWNWTDAKELFSFSGWHFLGTFSVVVRGTCINILINMFFNPIVNAGRAIGYQIESVVSQFAGNYFTAVKPQMYKAYSAGELKGLFSLINRSTILSMYLISIFLFPIVFNLPLLLKIWLGDIPQYAVVFCSLALFNCLIDATGSPTIAPALAYGRIKYFEIAISVVACLNLPISYVSLRLGASPQSTVYVSIMMSTIAVFVRVYFLKKMMGFPISPYIRILLRIALYSSTVYIILYLLSSILINEWLKLVVTTLVSIPLVTVTYIYSADKRDREVIIEIIKGTMLKFVHYKK